MYLQIMNFGCPNKITRNLISLALFFPDQRSHSAIDLHCQAQLITPREKRETRETFSDRSGPSHSLATLQSLALFFPDQRGHSAIDLHCQAQLIAPREKRETRETLSDRSGPSHSLATLQSLALFLPDQRGHSAIDLDCQAQCERSTKCILPWVLDSMGLFRFTQESSYGWCKS